MTDFKDLIAQGGVIVDVRTPQEFADGNAPGSVNIPLPELESKIDFMKSKCCVVLVCRSGARAQSALMGLEAQGIKAYNAGPWQTMV